MSHIFKQPHHIVPSSVTVNTGGTPVGTIAGVQTLGDGSVYQVPEVTGTPGWDIQFDWTNVGEVYGVVYRIRYAGLASHFITVRLYDYVAAADKSIDLLSTTGAYYIFRTWLIPADTKWTDGSGNAQLTFYHETAGNAAHDVYFDYVAILGREA